MLNHAVRAVVFRISLLGGVKVIALQQMKIYLSDEGADECHTSDPEIIVSVELPVQVRVCKCQSITLLSL